MLFNFQPEGSKPFLERIEFSTDVPISTNGTEARRRLRSTPRYRYEYTLPVTDDHSNGHNGILAALRDASTDWLVPLWPHASNAPAFPQLALDSAGTIVCFDAKDVATQSTVAEVTAAFAAEVPTARQQLLKASVQHVPAALGRIVEARRITHTTDSFGMAQVAFSLYNHQEIVGTFPVGDDGKATFDFDVDWSAGASEEITPAENVVDFGGLWAAETKYTTRTLSVPVYLYGAEELARFRAFVFEVQGRFKSFWATPAPDALPSLWRLNSDAIEISHVKPGEYAVSALTFKQVSN